MSRDVLAFNPRLRLLVFRAAFAIAEGAPIWFGRTLAYLLGTVGWLIDHRGRRVVRRNLAHFLPPGCPEALSRAVRRNYLNFAFSLCESFGMRGLARAHFQPPQLELVDPWGTFRTRPFVGPAVFTTVHANWIMALGAYHHLGLITSIEAIRLSHGDAEIDALFERVIAPFGCRSLLLDRAPLASLRALKDGRQLAVVAERDYTGTGMPVRFAGETTRMPIGPAALAVQTGAPVIPNLMARRSAGRFVLIVGRPVHADPTRPKSEQVAELTHRLARIHARFIAAAPAQWVAFHDAWAR
jgi:lauroyl/myristoyl acyltransferase